MDFSRITSYLPQIQYSDILRYRTMVSNRCTQLYSKLPDIRTLARTYIPMAYNKVRPFVMEHKERIIGAVAVSLYVWMAIRHHRRQPQFPIVGLRSSLHIATLSIETLKNKVIPTDATLIFCVDTSISMKGPREAEVERGVKLVLDHALGVVNTRPGAQIKIGIVGFSDDAYTICEPTMITSDSIEGIKGKLKNYQYSNTNIVDGLDQATAMLERMAKSDSNATHTLILLTDGENNRGSMDDVPGIRSRLAAVNAKLFAIGIEGHKEGTLRRIAPNEGEYIDTTKGGKTIVGAISAIYEQAIAEFSELVLSTAQLAAGHWSVDGVPSVEVEGRSTCQLGSFTEEAGVVKKIKILYKQIPSLLELRGLSFKLRFTDPRGRKGEMDLSWVPTTAVDPQVFQQV